MAGSYEKSEIPVEAGTDLRRRLFFVLHPDMSRCDSDSEFFISGSPEQRLRQRKHTTKPEKGKQRQNDIR